MCFEQRDRMDDDVVRVVAVPPGEETEISELRGIFFFFLARSATGANARVSAPLGTRRHGRACKDGWK